MFSFWFNGSCCISAGDQVIIVIIIHEGREWWTISGRHIDFIVARFPLPPSLGMEARSTWGERAHQYPGQKNSGSGSHQFGGEPPGLECTIIIISFGSFLKSMWVGDQKLNILLEWPYQEKLLDTLNYDNWKGLITHCHNSLSDHSLSSFTTVIWPWILVVISALCFMISPKHLIAFSIFLCLINFLLQRLTLFC